MNLATIAQREAYIAWLAPQTLAPGSYYTSVFNLSNSPAHRFIAKLLVGSVGAGGTVDFRFQWSTSAGGPFFDVDAVNCAVRQVDAGARIVTAEFPAEAVSGISPVGLFMRGFVYVQHAACDLAVLVEAHDLRFESASSSNIAAVTQQLVYSS